jgi:alpha-L-arabinofuranosidase
VSTLHMICAQLADSASLEHPDAIAPKSQTIGYSKDFSLDLEPYTVAVVEIRAE